MLTDKKEPLPTADKIKREGRFMGYSLEMGENYAEVFRYKNKNFVLLDEWNKETKRLVYRTHRYRARIGLLVNGFSEQNGSIL